MARSRLRGWPVPVSQFGKVNVGLIGCGQFAFSTVCFYLKKQRSTTFLSAFDPLVEQAQSLAHYYGFREIAPSPDALLNHAELAVLYVTSNHASHTPYAIAGLKRNKIVYIEKPISVSREQLVQLTQAIRQSTGNVFAGYNRPYARAIQLLHRYVANSAQAGPFSLYYVINGHLIPPDHWYRHPNEGTRICGNLSHWIDLTIHILAWRNLPEWLDIQLIWANPTELDDNLNVTLTTDKHDLISIQLTSRSEPFEGIREFINIQYNNVIAQIDDFRQMTVWQGAHRKTWRFSPKDVGHERAILQPFCQQNRPWAEVELSTLLTLFICDKIRQRQSASRFWTRQQVANLEADSQRSSTSLSTINP
ncbi:Gfo/Idh/MocA family oxidoreductase [Spirosoma sp. BT702]|uniref:Gfo/Idh/MocA family oxidoreductase n=1 Tax=Spirosoma profusum TaxID=2771354 RepID=A0A927G9N5_9BACT|nr:Gfo/Idh/MocA family oxidoreductase [Spirosoma profusum]MBD2704796.1 Gfo/Idh/MocA family oxidoreductase [Spirosoma profusum]